MVSQTYFKSCARIYRKDKKGVLHSLESSLLDKIITAVARGETSVELRPNWPMRSPSFHCNLKTMTALNRITGGVEDLIIEFPWDAKSFVAIVAQAADQKLRRQILVMALDRIRRTPRLSKILANKTLPEFTVRENPYLGPGHAPYENFIESLFAMMEASAPGGEKLFGKFLECAEDEAKDESFSFVEKRGIRTVFHGTNHRVMDAILNSGLDPTFRNPDLSEDYFGIDYQRSLQYTKTKTTPSPTRFKLLVFMIISEPDDRPNSRAVTVQSNKFQLPLAEITLT